MIVGNFIERPSFINSFPYESLLLIMIYLVGIILMINIYYQTKERVVFVIGLPLLTTISLIFFLASGETWWLDKEAVERNPIFNNIPQIICPDTIISGVVFILSLLVTGIILYRCLISSGNKEQNNEKAH